MDKLGFISQQLDAVGVPYEFGEWASDVKYPYTVGEITEEPVDTEDGKEKSTLLITAYYRGKGAFLELERIKNTIKKHFHPVYGLRGDTDGGAIAVFFDGCFYVPTGEADLKRLQINLKIIEWKGEV